MSRTMNREVVAEMPNPERHGLPMPNTGTAVAIATRLRSAIADGIYVDGERLPAERRLAEAFSSSRTTIREALRLLASEKFISRRVGSGTFVTFSHDTEKSGHRRDHESPGTGRSQDSRGTPYGEAGDRSCHPSGP